MADWLVALVLRKAAQEFLKDAGENCYRPRYRERVTIRGKRTYAARYLLGHYMLVERRPDAWIDQVIRIHRTPGIAGLLLCDEKPLIAREREVAQLRAREINGFIPTPHKVRFIRSQRIIVSCGAFQGQFGRFVREWKALDVVELDLLGGAREITLPMGCIVAVA